MEPGKEKASGQKFGKEKKAFSKQQYGQKDETASRPTVKGQGVDKQFSRPPGSPAPGGNVTSLQVQGGKKHTSIPPCSPAPKGKPPHVPGQGGEKQNAKPPGSPAPMGNVTSLQVQGGNKHNFKPPLSPASKGKAPHVQGQGVKKENAKTRSSPGQMGTVTPVQGQGRDKQNSKLPGSPASTEKVTPLDGQEGDKQQASAPGSPGTKKIASVEGQGGDEQRAKSEIAQSSEDLDVSGTSVKKAFEEEVRRLKAENQYLKTIMDYLHTILFVGVSTPQLELKPPEDIQNDQSILEFNRNAQKVARRFQELETELDIISTRMSQFSSTNAGGQVGKGETESKDRSNKTADNGHSPENVPASTPAPFEPSFDHASPVSKEKNEKESNIENVSSPMEERSGFELNLERGDESTGHRNITEASDKTSTRKDVGENKMNPPERKHNILERVDEVEKMISKQKDVIQKLKSDLKEAKTKLQDSQKLEEQVESLRMRLSELAGAKYTKDNANVADLSDPNRPTKLAEEYSELYSNEWSDAFEQQCRRKSKPSEEKVIKKLLDILLAGFKYCKSVKDDQNSDLREIVLFPARDKSIKEVNEENIEMNEVIVRTLTEAIKRSGEMTGEHVAKVFVQRKETKEMLKKGTEGLAVYVHKCVKLCWLMQVQTPPVCIDLTAKPGEQFYKDTYREYTKKGNKIEFIVWPPLRLHEGGPLLAKGVAQGK